MIVLLKTVPVLVQAVNAVLSVILNVMLEANTL